MDPAAERMAGWNDVAGGLAVAIGALTVGYGALLVSVSTLGGVWIGAIGASLALAGALATDWLGSRIGLDAVTRRRLATGFAALAGVLLVAFVAVNGAGFEPGSATGRLRDT